MKRLIAAAIILVFIISVCAVSHIYVDRACQQTLNDVERYYNQEISADALQKSWSKQKEKMSVFVNHSFLDKISVYIGQLDTQQSLADDAVYKNIKTLLSLINEEQRLELHRFY